METKQLKLINMVFDGLEDLKSLSHNKDYVFFHELSQKLKDFMSSNEKTFKPILKHNKKTDKWIFKEVS